jgi:hypothetical protein
MLLLQYGLTTDKRIFRFLAIRPYVRGREILVRVLYEYEVPFTPNEGRYEYSYSFVVRMKKESWEERTTQTMMIWEIPSRAPYCTTDAWKDRKSQV